MKRGDEDEMDMEFKTTVTGVGEITSPGKAYSKLADSPMELNH